MLKIKAIIVYKNKVAKIYNCKLNEGETFINIKNQSYNITDSDGFLIGSRRPKMTYFYNAEEPNPINPFTGKVSIYTPEQYNKAMNTKLLNTFLDMSKPKLELGIFVSIFIIIVLLIGGFFMYKKIDGLYPEEPITTNPIYTTTTGMWE